MRTTASGRTLKASVVDGSVELRVTEPNGSSWRCGPFRVPADYNSQLTSSVEQFAEGYVESGKLDADMFEQVVERALRRPR